jgi:hypothetical protein
MRNSRARTLRDPAGVLFSAPFAGVAELAYAGPSKGPGLRVVWVRVPPPAPGEQSRRENSGAARSVPNPMTTEDARGRAFVAEEIALHKWIRALVLAGFASLAFAVVAPGAALAQYREFTGRIDKINDKKMIVDNRQGDKVTFDKLPDTKVDDTHEAKKKSWSDLKSDDWVNVKWKMVDKPRKAYEVIVIPPKKEAGEDAQ